MASQESMVILQETSLCHLNKILRIAVRARVMLFSKFFENGKQKIGKSQS